MPSKVQFASARMKKLSAEDSLPAKFQRMLKKYDLKAMFDGKRVAIKMHVGGHLGYTTIHPLFFRLLVSAVKEAGGSPFLTDGSYSVGGAVARGYTAETVGAPIYPICGTNDSYFYEKKVGYRGLKKIQVAGEIADAEAMVVFSHGKGHGQCGFGGAIKNLAMGAVTTRTRGWIHGVMDTEFHWDAEKCKHCGLCVANCPGGAAKFNDKKELQIFSHHCRYCMHCVDSCPVEAIAIGPHSMRYFQDAMARTTKVVLDTFEPGRVFYLTALLNVTPLCDCWGFTTPSLVPDIGIMASTDIVAIEQAAIDSIKTEDYIEGSLPEQVRMGDEGHLLYRIWAKDPYLQVETAAKLGLGDRKYQLVEVK
jgi:uncharacterized Fe-S center protein